MKSPYVAGLVLAAVYLLMPPPDVAGDHFRINFSAPLSGWVELRRFNSECNTALEAYRRKPAGGLPAMLESKLEAMDAMRAAKCISTNDRRLNKN